MAFTPGSVFYAEEAPLPAVLGEALEEVNGLLHPGRLSVEVVRVRRAQGEDPLTFQIGNHAGLERLFMYFRPLSVATPTLSPSQFRIMRRHPAVVWR